ncbi:hypothetical protein ACFL3F_03810 [Planctomycetota bacterium]
MSFEVIATLDIANRQIKILTPSVPVEYWFFAMFPSGSMLPRPCATSMMRQLSSLSKGPTTRSDVFLIVSTSYEDNEENWILLSPVLFSFKFGFDPFSSPLVPHQTTFSEIVDSRTRSGGMVRLAWGL